MGPSPINGTHNHFSSFGQFEPCNMFLSITNQKKKKHLRRSIKLWVWKVWTQVVTWVSPSILQPSLANHPEKSSNAPKDCRVANLLQYLVGGVCLTNLLFSSKNAPKMEIVIVNCGGIQENMISVSPLKRAWSKLEVCRGPTTPPLIITGYNSNPSYPLFLMPVIGAP